MMVRESPSHRNSFEQRKIIWMVPWFHLTVDNELIVLICRPNGIGMKIVNWLKMDFLPSSTGVVRISILSKIPTISYSRHVDTVNKLLWFVQLKEKTSSCWDTMKHRNCKKRSDSVSNRTLNDFLRNAWKLKKRPVLGVCGTGFCVFCIRTSIFVGYESRLERSSLFRWCY